VPARAIGQERDPGLTLARDTGATHPAESDLVLLADVRIGHECIWSVGLICSELLDNWVRAG
jgi:hypothetical protein